MLEVEGEQHDHRIVPHSFNISEVGISEKVEEELSCSYANEVGIFQKTLLVTFVN